MLCAGFAFFPPPGFSWLSVAELHALTAVSLLAQCHPWGTGGTGTPACRCHHSWQVLLDLAALLSSAARADALVNNRSAFSAPEPNSEKKKK